MAHVLQVDEVKCDYISIVGWWRWWIWPDPESYVFSRISCGEKPSSRQRIGELTMQCYCNYLPSSAVAKNGVYSCSTTGVVHGNLDIGNFVFNPEVRTYVCTYVCACVCVLNVYSKYSTCL